MSDVTAAPMQLEPVSQKEWSAYLERRVMRLLLVHDRGAFRKQFELLRSQSDVKEHPLFQQYDQFLQIVILGDELLDDILPRIRRQLSLHTDHERRREEAPTQGDIDWRRTIDRSLRDMPGQPPVNFDTRLRQRSTATLENIMVVAVLQHFGKALREIQQTTLLDQALTEREQQTIISMLERLERELAAPYAQLLAEQAHEADLEQLIEQVEQRLAPGANPYRDLIEWWQRFTNLSFGRADNQQHDAYARRRNEEKAVAWLYEFWIALELLHMLHEDPQADLQPAEQQKNTPALLDWSFTWHAQRWRFRYNRQLQNDRWLQAPATRPDYLIEREQPREVRHGDTLIWRESGILLDAKYYMLSDQEQPIKKMLGEMTLLDASQAYLFLPQLPEHPRTIAYNQARYPGRNAEIQVHLHQLAPNGNVAELHSQLTHILDACIQQFAQPEPIACYGRVFDRDSVNEHGRSAEHVRIFCPKPHISRNVFDIVQPSDCLNNPQVCHVIGQAITPPYVQRILDDEDLITATKQIRKRVKSLDPHDDSDSAEIQRTRLMDMLGQLTEDFVQQTRADTSVAEASLKRHVFGSLWGQLDDHARKMLISGEYVWIQLESTKISDWSVAVVQFVRTLEYEMHRRLYDPCQSDLKRGIKRMKKEQFTFGCWQKIYERQYADTRDNWNVWQTRIVRPLRIDPNGFEELIRDIVALTDFRNSISHTDIIDHAEAEKVYTTIVGTASSGLGLLVRLIKTIPLSST